MRDCDEPLAVLIQFHAASQKQMRNGGTFIVVVCSWLGVRSPLPIFAVNPLVTDDADPVEHRRLQIDTGWQFSRTASIKYHTLPINAVVGIHPRGKFGLTFGHQWRHGHGAAPHTEDTNG